MKYSLAVLALAGGVQSWSPTVGLRRQQLSTLRSTSASEPSSALRDEGESTVTPDEAALANISEEPATIGSMLSTRTTSLARRDAVEALSTALTRSIERSGEVTGLLAEELTSVAKLLENEIISEEEKLASLRSLIGKMTDVVKGKAGIIEREKELLTKIEDIKAQTLEAVIKSRLEQAVEAKAELITIETELSETIEACKAQLEAELPLSEKRLGSMQKAKNELPSSTGTSADVTAVRAYGFSELVTLQDLLIQTQRSAEASELEVAALREKIASAMAQRNKLLDMPPQPQVKQEPAAVAAKTSSTRAVPGGSPTQAGAETPRANTGVVSAAESRSSTESNEVELTQRGVLKAGSALLGIAKAVVKTVSNEEGVGSTLRVAIEDAKGASSAFGDARKKLFNKE